VVYVSLLAPKGQANNQILQHIFKQKPKEDGQKVLYKHINSAILQATEGRN